MTPDSVSYVAAFGGGLVPFLSPCVLPLVPAYLSIITGLDVTEPGGGHDRLVKVARDTGPFVLGFSVVFVVLGLSATSIVRVCSATSRPHPGLGPDRAGDGAVSCSAL